MPLDRLKDPDAMIRAGLVLLVVANVAQWILLRGGAGLASSGLAGAATGLAWGLSFGLILVGLRRRSRPGAGCGPN